MHDTELHPTCSFYPKCIHTDKKTGGPAPTIKANLSVPQEAIPPYTPDLKQPSTKEHWEFLRPILSIKGYNKLLQSLAAELLYARDKNDPNRIRGRIFKVKKLNHSGLPAGMNVTPYVLENGIVQTASGIFHYKCYLAYIKETPAAAPQNHETFFCSGIMSFLASNTASGVTFLAWGFGSIFSWPFRKMASYCGNCEGCRTKGINPAAGYVELSGATALGTPPDGFKGTVVQNPLFAGGAGPVAPAPPKRPSLLNNGKGATSVAIPAPDTYEEPTTRATYAELPIILDEDDDYAPVGPGNGYMDLAEGTEFGEPMYAMATFRPPTPPVAVGDSTYDMADDHRDKNIYAQTSTTVVAAPPVFYDVAISAEDQV